MFVQQQLRSQIYLESYIHHYDSYSTENRIPLTNTLRKLDSSWKAFAKKWSCHVNVWTLWSFELCWICALSQSVCVWWCCFFEKTSFSCKCYQGHAPYWTETKISSSCLLFHSQEDKLEKIHEVILAWLDNAQQHIALIVFVLTGSVLLRI